MKRLKVTRIWHGKTKLEDADEYQSYLERTGISDYKKVNGNLSTKLLRRVDGNICHFLTITEWDSYDSIKNFTGPDYKKARYYDEDRKYLLDFEDEVVHYETLEY